MTYWLRKNDTKLLAVNWIKLSQNSLVINNMQSGYSLPLSSFPENETGRKDIINLFKKFKLYLQICALESTIMLYSICNTSLLQNMLLLFVTTCTNFFTVIFPPPLTLFQSKQYDFRRLYIVAYLITALN